MVDVVGRFTLQSVGSQHVLHGVGMRGVVLVVLGTSPPRQGHLSSLSYWRLSDPLLSLYHSLPSRLSSSQLTREALHCLAGAVVLGWEPPPTSTTTILAGGLAPHWGPQYLHYKVLSITARVGHLFISSERMRIIQLGLCRAIFLDGLRQVSDVLQAAVSLHGLHGLLDDLIRNSTHVLLERDSI